MQHIDVHNGSKRTVQQVDGRAVVHWFSIEHFKREIGEALELYSL